MSQGLSNMMRTETVKNFLLSNTHADLAAMYNYGMEVQVNVAQDGGVRVEGEYAGKPWLAWTDHLTTWKSFRIPYKANTEPEYTDKPMTYNLSAHVEGVGMTGWDWNRKCSIWFAYDFDALTGHSDRHAKKLTDSELGDIRDIVSNVPWVTLRTSTSGKGLHLYVTLRNPIATRNHHEHAALARAVLAKLSGACAYDFANKVDICGGNMWVWHRKMLDSSGQKIGLKIIKSGELLDSIPNNWQDHINVIRGKIQKTIPTFVKDAGIDEIFDELTGQRSRMILDKDHKRLLDFFQERNCTWWWDQDHWMLVTHTSALKQAHNILDLKGTFDTIAMGDDPGDHNCFAYPLARGAWAVRRYSPGTQEANTWEQDGSNWTKCFLNRDMDFDLACRVAGGLEHPKGGYHFTSVETMFRAIKFLGAKIDCNPSYMDRSGLLNLHKEEGKVVVNIPSNPTDIGECMIGWFNEKKFWKRVVQIKVPPKLEGESTIVYDDLVRHLICDGQEDYGWVIKSEGKWNTEPLVHIKAALTSMAYNQAESTGIIGENIFRPWKLVNRPFQIEYPGDRTWNRDAAQLKYIPNPEPGDHPTWDKILNHCGKNLDDAVKLNRWCQLNGIIKGSEYLKCWAVSLIKYPTEPLPYLFFYGDQDTGKSSFHEALHRLFNRGYVRADQALRSQSGFNGELESAVLCIVEETDLRKNQAAYAKIKDWVTSLDISIHIKMRTPFMLANTTHWIQCANDRGSCPIFPGDTRITMIYVDPIPAEEMIGKRDLIRLLDKEAPDFLASIMRTELPFNNERLNIPIIKTDDKMEAESVNETELQTFLNECCHYVPGQTITFSEFYDRFTEWLPANKVGDWSKRKVSSEIPMKFPRGKLTTNPNAHIGNISFEATAAVGRAFYRDGIWLRIINENISTRTSETNGQGHVGELFSEKFEIK